MEDGQGCADEDIVLHIPFPQAVSDREDSACNFSVYQGPDKDTAQGVQSRYGGLADGSSARGISARMGYGAGSFVRSERKDLPHRGQRFSLTLQCCK